MQEPDLFFSAKIKRQKAKVMKRKAERLRAAQEGEEQGMVEEEEETVRVHIPARVGDYTLIEKPVRGLGLHNLYLRLYVRVMS